MADSARRRMAFTVFEEAPVDEEDVVALLITRADDGTYRAYVQESPGRTAPHPEAVAMLTDAVRIANL